MKYKFLFLLLIMHIKVFTQTAPNLQKIDSLMNYLKSENSFSGSIALKKGSQILYEGDYNSISTGTGIYKIGSVTKVYTAIIIFQLIEEGHLNLKSTLNQFFPVIKNSEQITIENLLSHTSGIFNVTSWKYYGSTRADYFTRDQILDLIKDHKPEFKPNSECSYSNSNFILLGFIIEDITKKTYAVNVKERISDAKVLSDTYCETNTSNRMNREQSYKFNGEIWVPDIDSDPSLPSASGAIVSTPGEMCDMLYHLFNKGFISDSSLKVMKTLRNKSTGHGLFKAPFYEREGWGHSGRIDEFRAFTAYFPEDSLSLSITSNGMNYKLNDIVAGVLSIYYGRKYEFPVFTKTAIVDPPAEHFTGKYKAKLAGVITIARFQLTSAGKNHLYMSETFNPLIGETVLIERKDKMIFYSKDVGGELTFIENKKGKIKGIKLKQGNFNIRCKKVG